MKHKLFTQLRLFGMVLFSFFLQHHLSAQCACVNPTPATAGQISPASDCMAKVFATGLLDDDFGCSDDVLITVIAFGGDTLAMGVDSVEVDLSDHLNTIIHFDLSHPNVPSMCKSYYLVEDKQPPIISFCPRDTVFCTSSLDPVNIKPIVYSDNCTVDPTVEFADDTVGINCAFTPSEFIGRVDRTYTVTDDQDSVTTCVQEIYIRRPTAADVTIPDDATIDCTETAAFALTGQPTIDGNPIVPGGLCNFAFAVVDDTLGAPMNGCADYIIQRTWLLNDCNSNTVMDSTQLIFVEDMTAPEISCPAISPVNVNPGTCSGSVTLPLPTVIEDCSTFEITASIPGYGSGFVYNNLPADVYNVFYIATDACGMFSVCESVLSVIDDETPTAVCDGVVIVAIPNNGTATIDAEEFDNGSSDNCSTNLIFEVSDDGVNFGPDITFTCDDVGPDTVMVTLKVTDATDLTSMNTCMNQVVVQDKLNPILACPDDLTIDCETNMDDLEDFGMPTIFDGCGFDLENTVVESIDQCGLGSIVRTWTATDPSGNSSTCSQTITVQNQTPFDGTGIVFPDDYTLINGCVTIDDLEPEDLPSGFDEPQLPAVACAMLAINWDDQVFYFDYPACYKVVRTWQVMDMCQFDPLNPGDGIWTAQQVIAVMDSQPPTIDFCPPGDTFGLDANCGPATVTLMPVMASGNCPNEDIIITNDSPYANPGNPGSDASGVYPEGTHVITFTVTDGCGNSMQCATTVVVADLKKPTPYCSNGTIAELQAMPNVPIMAVVTAEHLNFASFDNCTDEDDLIFQIRRAGTGDPLASSITFDCADQGENEVEVWVTDEAGNSDFCVAPVIIQDNMDLCNDDDLVAGNIGGVVLTTAGEQLPDVHIEIPDMSMEDMTDEVGDYIFEDLEIGNTYNLEPWKNDDPLNGITTFDLLLMTKHVLDTEPLTDPYLLIAADVNNSGAVTTGDILELRKMVLHIYDEFPNNTSWRFVRADYVFPNPHDPFTPAFPENFNVPNHDEDDVMDADFVAVKIGDLNGSAAASFQDDNLGDRSGEGVKFLIEDRKIEAGETFTVPFRLSETNSLHALQFTLEFETDLELQGIEKSELPGVTGDRFETARQSEANAVTGLWFNTTPVKVSPADALFSLRFQARRAGRLSEFLHLTSSYTAALAHDENGMEQDLKIEFENSSTMAFQLHQNQPNPFKKVTHIGFTLPESGPAKLIVYDLSGSVLHTWEQDCEQGFNQVSIQRSELPSNGVLYYQLETANNTATKKMILLQ